MAVFEIGYDGFMRVTAKDEKAAMDKANAILSKAKLINDGENGEWYLISSEQVDE